MTSPTHFKNIPGWFSEEEAALLYDVVTTTEGPVLEIGHFLGRSTSVICEAIHDGGSLRTFRSYDLGFETESDFLSYYTSIYQSDSFDIPPEFSQVYQQGQISTELAFLNLKRVGLEGLVELISGFFQSDPHKYHIVFADVMHDPVEIRQNLHDIIRVSSDSCLWLFHDMCEENIQQVCGISEARAQLLSIADSLGLFSFTR